MSKIKLFCFPYAGGSAQVYREWKQYPSEVFEVIPVELAGHGRRMTEPLYEDVSEMLEDIYPHVIEQVGSSDYAFFGHSMGGMLAFELVHRIRKSSGRLPMHLFFSGRGAPHIRRTDKIRYHLLEEEDFKKEVLNLGGTPPEFFAHPELLEIYLPILKNDFRLSETRPPITEIEEIDVHLTALVGLDENLNEEERFGWQLHTSKSFELYQFEGEHFFIHNYHQEILRLIDRLLSWPRTKQEVVTPHLIRSGLTV
ncbi:MAG: alpha/beta fold hydrolase [Cytophagales bacterium]|nr:alpha/beta fold hydrolase [Cytophagales bacterium]